jgi:glycosyltransferase involved in cell wall biosynthesis
MVRNSNAKNNSLLIIKIKIILIIIIYILYIKIKDLLFKMKMPKVSVFLPIYNKQLYLNRSINSIQIQTLKDIEIVAVNDCSTDYSLKMLKNMAKKDNRIKVINNDRNHGLLYSRAMGIINSSGEYVMNLDPDDKLEWKDNLAELYNYSKIYNLDFLRFLHRRIPRDKLDIGFCKFLDKNQLNVEDIWITNKFIKKNVFIKAYNNFKSKIYLYKWNYHEDNIWSKLIYKYSNSHLIFKKPIYVVLRNTGSLMANLKHNKIELKNRFYRLETYLKLNLVSLKSTKKELRFFKSIIHNLKDKEMRKKIIFFFLNIKIS